MQYSKQDIDEREGEFIEKIRSGSIFIYPTDTIYGLGCDAANSESVKKIRHIKQRKDRPFSVIVPSNNWIEKNCKIDEKARKWLEKLPGPYTLVLKLKAKNCIAEETNLGYDTIGIRIPDHWISKFVRKIGVPIVTTSVNISETPYLKSIDDLPEDFGTNIEFAINGGNLLSSPSTIINLVEDKIIKRK